MDRKRWAFFRPISMPVLTFISPASTYRDPNSESTSTTSGTGPEYAINLFCMSYTVTRCMSIVWLGLENIQIYGKTANFQ